GDTILLPNTFISGATYAGLHIIGQNALGITLIGGDVQSCYKWGILCEAGQAFVYGTSFQNQNNGPDEQINQIWTDGADIGSSSGSGGGGVCEIRDTRSESDVAVNSIGNNVYVDHAFVNGGDL